MFNVINGPDHTIKMSDQIIVDGKTYHKKDVLARREEIFDTLSGANYAATLLATLGPNMLDRLAIMSAGYIVAIPGQPITFKHDWFSFCDVHSVQLLIESDPAPGSRLTFIRCDAETFKVLEKEFYKWKKS